MKWLLIAFLFTALSLLAAACGQSSRTEPGTVIKSAPVGNNLTVTLSNKDGFLKHGEEEFFLSFNNSTGKLVGVDAVALNFYMPGMGTMPAMNSGATFTTTDTPGVYHGTIKLEMAGDWQAEISYEGPSGKGKTSLSITAQ